MGGIFISHSSKNNGEAEPLRDWLEDQGWGRSQVFLDLRDLKSGDKWRDVLNAMHDCEGVIACVSDEWLTSAECLREFNFAERDGKPIFPIFVRQVTVPIPRFVTDVQIGDTSAEGLSKLRDQLIAHRIAPHTFPWPPKEEPNRSVYRGLSALDIQDAAIFFGRDADILRGMDELRMLRNGALQRMLVILGASGAGKSSFLRAGLIARLRRDDENFLVMPIIRPDRAAISGALGLNASISGALGRAATLKDASDLALAFAELRKPVVERLTRNAEAAGDTYSSKPPTIIIPLDQAEELFAGDNLERDKFCGIAADALSQDGNALMIATIRSDSYGSLQRCLMPEVQRPFTLPPIAAGSWQAIIEGPAQLAQPPFSVEPALIQELIADAERNALPLLAFALERLLLEYGQSGELALVDYREKLGGLSGAIQSAVDAVMGSTPTKEKLALARRLFVPALVQVDQDGVKRRIARRVDIDADVQALADQFINQRLLVADGGTIEVAHEAILKHWLALSSWITEERLSLATLDAVRAAATEWQAHFIRRDAKGGESWLAHRGDRLKEAEKIVARRDLASAVDDNMRAYLAACRAEERREKAGRRRLQTLAAVLGFVLLGAGVAWMNRDWIGLQYVRLTAFASYVKPAGVTAALRPGQTFQECAQGSNNCPMMIVIPAGQFIMGDDQQRDNRPRPVSIARFAVSPNDITFAEWDACADAGGCRGQTRPGDEGWGRGSRPVINVSWDDAKEYVTWLSQMTGQRYRLLSEAEWEYAARGYTSLRDPHYAYTWGDADPVCDHRAPNGTMFHDCPDQRTLPVGSFSANRFGLFDMAGNVSQWVEDCDQGDLSSAPGDGSAVETNACPYRENRGGSWVDSPEKLRSAYRSSDTPTSRYNALGFRVARTL